MKTFIEYLLACMGTAAIAALAYFELPMDNVAIGYAVITVAVLTVAWLTHQEIFLYQSLAMMAVTSFRLAMHNFYNLHSSFAASVSAPVWAILVLLAGVPVAFRMRAAGDSTRAQDGMLSFLKRHPEQPLFFVPAALMAVLLFLKMPGDSVTLAWGVEGLAIFVLALFAKERSFRLAGLGMLLFCVAKIVVYDMWFQWNDKRLRFITLIVVGVILLVVPYLYGRNKDTFKEYL